MPYWLKQIKHSINDMYYWILFSMNTISFYKPIVQKYCLHIISIGITTWTVDLQNSNTVIAYSDILCILNTYIIYFYVSFFAISYI